MKGMKEKKDTIQTKCGNRKTNVTSVAVNVCAQQQTEEEKEEGQKQLT